MKISFVIPAHNEEARLQACLEAILADLKRTPIEAEILVVNNASTDQTRNVAMRFPGVIVVDEPRKGLLYARAAGLKRTTGDLIANIDADTRISADWIRTVRGEFERNPKLVCLSGPYIYYDISAWNRFLVRVFYLFGFLLYLVLRFMLRVGSMTQGGNFVCRKSALEAIGGFDTKINFYGEDTDIARRLSKVGDVKWTFRLPAYSSGRRRAHEGIIATGMRYMINFLWVTFFKKPLSFKAKDIRSQNNESK